MKLTTTLINVFASLLVVGGILMWVFVLPDKQISLVISLFGILFYVLAAPEQPRVYRRNLHQ
ncbi:hypothetical protein [Adhaeribacter pallidiroseus]|uniref:Uncharacterized protein n=1 Tax=Adhaeribacter pallidiroseus TaxID=2072847 RepID=A0A369QQM4_9BACT|nr:hypothetical protein [Adhaeribacter pallidiroseus]RDC65985.1 hypothetical protein AHMF7616_04616 [Adhaeribacter pallidiroseus]